MTAAAQSPRQAGASMPASTTATTGVDGSLAEQAKPSADMTSSPPTASTAESPTPAADELETGSTECPHHRHTRRHSQMQPSAPNPPSTAAAADSSATPAAVPAHDPSASFDSSVPLSASPLLPRSSSHVHALRDSEDVGIILTDGNQQITHVNATFSAITGYSASDSIGRNCMAQGTVIALADGTSLPIEEVGRGAEVLSYTAAAAGQDEGLSVRKVDAAFDRGERECVELLFSDGRTLVCTPDHRLRTADGRWVEAGRLLVGTDEVAVGVEYPNRSTAGEDHGAWRLRTRSTLGYDLDMAARAAHSLAFARVLGFALTDGCVTGDTCKLYIGHRLDADAVQRDLLLLTGLQHTVQVHERTLGIVVPRALVDAFKQEGVEPGKRLSKVTRFPAFVTDARCPLPVVREFLGGLFGGGDGLTLVARLEDGGKLRGLGFCTSRSGAVAAEQQTVLQAELFALLARCGVDCTSKVTSFLATVAPNTLTSAGRAELKQLQSQGAVVAGRRPADALDAAK